MAALIVFALGVGYATRQVDSPGGIVTWSGAFTTDEGFHSKWAQNAVRFGTIGDPYDFSFVPAGFLHNMATFAVFRAFGASFEVLRLYAAFLAALALLTYWAVLAHAPPPFPRWQVIALLVATVNYPAYARVLFIEPLGLVLSLASLWLAIRAKRPWWACAASVLLAFAAFLTKIHFLDVVCTVCLLWVARLTVWRESDRVDRGVLIALACSVAAMIIVTAALTWIFRGPIAEFVLYNESQFLGRSSAPLPLKVLSSELKVFGSLLENTHHAAFLVSLVVAGIALAARRPWRGAAPAAPVRGLFGKVAGAIRGLRDYELDVAMGLWLILGLLVRGSSSYQPSRYFYPLLFPLSYLAVRLLQQAPARYRMPIFAGALLIHLAVQEPLYYRWLYRKDIVSQYANRVSFAHEIEARAPPGPVVLLAGDAATYALFSQRIRPIEPEYVPPGYTLCDRIAYWRPTFYVSGGKDDPFMAQFRGCPGVAAIDEVKRERVFAGSWGERVLYSIGNAK
jgi:hypothetical protein